MTHKYKVVSTALILFFALAFFVFETYFLFRENHFRFTYVGSAVCIVLLFATELVKKLRVFSLSAGLEYMIFFLTDVLCLMKNQKDQAYDHALEIWFIIIFLIVSLLLLYPSKRFSKYFHLENLKTAPKTTEKVSKAFYVANITYIITASVILVLRYVFSIHADLQQISYAELLIWGTILFIPFQLLALSNAFAAKRAYGKLII